MDEELYIEDMITRFKFEKLTDEDKKNWEIEKHSPKEKMNTPDVYKSDDNEWDVEVFSSQTDFYTIRKK